MARLHELLAVEGDLEGAYKKILKETGITFTKRESHFLGSIRELKLTDDGAPEVAAEVLEMATTVPDKLKYQERHVIRYLDAVLQKEATNQNAKADLVVDGSVIARDLPATFLLGLETKLKQLRAVYELIPTHAPGIKWVPDLDKGEHVFRNDNVEETHKQDQIIEPVVMYKATIEHPAQVEKVAKRIITGKYSKMSWSGMLSPAKKSVLLGRIDALLRGTKMGRQRANRADVVRGTVGKLLFDYINTGLADEPENLLSEEEQSTDL